MKYSEDMIKLNAKEILEIIENCIAIQESEISVNTKLNNKRFAFDDIARLAEECEK